MKKIKTLIFMSKFQRRGTRPPAPGSERQFVVLIFRTYLVVTEYSSLTYGAGRQIISQLIKSRTKDVI